MHVSSVLAAALAISGGVSADETPTRSPTMSFAPTLTVGPSFAPTGVPQCEPQCIYDYHYSAEHMNKKILARVFNFIYLLVGICVKINLRRVRSESSSRPPCHRRGACSMAWLISTQVGMIVFSLGVSFLGHHIRHHRSHTLRCYYKRDGSGFEEDDDLDSMIQNGTVEELSTQPLDRRQVAVALKQRLDEVAGFSKYIIGFASLVIAQKAVPGQEKYDAFHQLNIDYAEGFIFFMLTFALFLTCSLIAGEIARQIGFGYICPVFVVLNWLLEVFNAFGVICFIHGTRKFQKSLGWTRDFKNLPMILAHLMKAAYLLFWLFSFLNSVSLITEWRVLTDSRKIVSVKSSAGYSDSWSLRHILRSIQFQVMPFRDPVLFEQFNCKPLNAAAAPDASVPITPGETEESAPKTGRRLSRFNEL